MEREVNYTTKDSSYIHVEREVNYTTMDSSYISYIACNQQLGWEVTATTEGIMELTLFRAGSSVVSISSSSFTSFEKVGLLFESHCQHFNITS